LIDQETKVRLLELLYSNARENAEDFADKLGLSRQTVSKLRQNFWDKGIIQSPTILLNPHSVGMQYFFMMIKTNPAEPEILAQLKSIPEICAIDGILGDYALYVKIEVRTKQKFAEILNMIDKNIARSMFQSYRIIETIDVFKLGGVILNRTSPYKQISDEKWNMIKLFSKNFNPNKWPERYDHEFFTADQLESLERLNLTREYEKLLSDNIIERFTITLTHLLPDFKLKFYMRIKPQEIGQYNELAEQLVKEPNIVELYRTGEDAGLLAVIRLRGIAAPSTQEDEKSIVHREVQYLQDFIKNLYSKYPILDTHTTVVIEEHIPTVNPPTLNVAEMECRRRIVKIFQPGASHV